MCFLAFMTLFTLYDQCACTTTTQDYILGKKKKMTTDKKSINRKKVAKLSGNY